MKNVDLLVRRLVPEIENRDILEAACGVGEFTNAASFFARSVSCIDLDDRKLRLLNRDNIHFQQMDASRMLYPDEAFDGVFFYNAFAHVLSQWEAIERECRRVLRPGGGIWVAATWKIDIGQMEKVFGNRVQRFGNFSVVKIEK